MNTLLPPGLHAGVPEAEYRADPGVNVSFLKVGVEGSLADMRAYRDHPDPPTDAMEFGTAVHAYLLQPDLFAKTYIVAPKFSGKGSVAARDEWMEAHKHLNVLTETEHANLLGAASAIAEHKDAAKIIRAAGDREVVAIWEHERTGARCKGRIDYANLGVGLLVDIKTSRNARPKPWKRQAADLLYHMQVAHYTRGFEAHGIADPSFVFIAVDQKPTNGRHFVGVYAMDPEWIEAGRRLCDDVLAGWLEAQERGEYPDECTGLMELEGPTWSLLQTPNVRPVKGGDDRSSHERASNADADEYLYL